MLSRCCLGDSNSATSSSQQHTAKVHWHSRCSSDDAAWWIKLSRQYFHHHTSSAHEREARTSWDSRCRLFRNIHSHSVYTNNFHFALLKRYIRFCAVRQSQTGDWTSYHRQAGAARRHRRAACWILTFQVKDLLTATTTQNTLQHQLELGASGGEEQQKKTEDGEKSII